MIREVLVISCNSLLHIEGLMIQGVTVVSCISLFHIEGLRFNE